VKEFKRVQNLLALSIGKIIDPMYSIILLYLKIELKKKKTSK
jgi:hypothetical protein